MTYRRTQILLDPEEHRRLSREAADRGISLAEHIRQLLASRVGEAPPAYDESSLEGLFDLADTGRKDTVETMDEEAALAFETTHRRRPRRAASTRRTRS